MLCGKKEYADINSCLNAALAAKKHLIAVHRGTWHGNIIQSSTAAFGISFRMGADMVEADVNSSTDGILYCFHDGHEPDVLGTTKNIKTMSSAEIEAIHPRNCLTLPCSRRLNRLTEVLAFLKPGQLLNIDRAWDIFPKLLALLDTIPDAKYKVLLKAPLRAKDALQALNDHPVKYMFMPICYSMADVEAALAYPEINVVGAEIIAFTEQHELFADEAIAAIHEKGLFCWVNAITLGDVARPGHTVDDLKLYAGLDDDISVIDDPDKGWGKLFEKQIDILQTDWPSLLYTYRKERLGVE